MPLLLIAAMFTASPEPVICSSVAEAAAVIGKEARTGTLIFSKGDCLAIKIFTQSPYTHVAAVVVRYGKPFVYDSMQGVGVRCQTLENYVKSQDPDQLHLMHPGRKFTEKKAEAYVEHLEGQLGRPYAIKHHLTGKRAPGVHCSEYVTDALMHCELIRAKHPSRVSPASLAEGILQANLYSAAETISIERPTVAPKGSNWCDQLWLDTKLCTTRCCIQLRRWVLCH